MSESTGLAKSAANWLLRTFWDVPSPPPSPSLTDLANVATASVESEEPVPSPVKREYLTQPRQKRHRPAPKSPMHIYPPDLMNQGTQRMLEAHRARFSLDTERSVLLVHLPNARRAKIQRLPEEYPLCGSAEDLRSMLAEEEITDLMQLAVEFPRFFWNAAYWCGGDIERVEKEMLLIR